MPARREALAVGALLQCKGLMEIVAATILRDKGLLSEHAFAALVTLAVLSTLFTGPTFRCIMRRASPRSATAVRREPRIDHLHSSQLNLRPRCVSGE